MATVPKAPAGYFNVLYFASASSFTAKQYESFPAPLPLKNLFSILEERYKGMQAKVLDSCLVTINLEYADMTTNDNGDMVSDEVVIKEDDEVAIIPPVSSG